jgi:hypothetical protein
VRLASRGQREVEGAAEPVTDRWLAGQLQRQAREILVEAVLLAALATGLTLMLPG